MGSSFHDTGAAWIEFVASTDDVALLELTNDTGSGQGTMRIWLGEDAHNLSLLGRPKVDTTVTLCDTGWSNASTGGAFATAAVDLIPTMTGDTTSGVTITASSQNRSYDFGGDAFYVGDNDNTTRWIDTGEDEYTLPSWINVDFGASNTKAISSYSIRADDDAGRIPHAPRNWELLTGNYDTGTYATDTGKWTLVDVQTGQTSWGVSEKRTFTRDDADTGTIESRRHWRLYVTAIADGTNSYLMFNELELFDAATANQAKFSNCSLTLNATSIGAVAKAKKRVIVSDTGTEHSLDIIVERGPVVLRVGSTDGDDDYISETSIGTGYHNLSFTPQGNFWITLQSEAIVDRIVSSLSIGDSGTVEIRSPWGASYLDYVRYDQSADVVYVDCEGVRPSKIERRGTGRSWSIVDYAPNNGPFLVSPSSSAKMSVNHFFGNITVNTDAPFFSSSHEGALMRIFHEGQGGQWRLGALDAATDSIKVTGLGDTGTDNNNERRIIVSASGIYSGTVIIERTHDTSELGFKAVDYIGAYTGDTGTFTRTLDDPDDNSTVSYRARLSAYASGVATITITYPHGGITGICRVTGYNTNTSVSAEVLSRFSDTGLSDNWQEGYWSEAQSFPTAVALHGGRLCHAGGGNLFLSVSDDYENFSDSTVGDAAPIVRTLGSGPVNRINFLISKLRLLIGTSGAELALISSSLDEPVTRTNSNARQFATQGSARLRALPMDTKALMVQRSGTRLFMIGPSQNTFGEYESFELTLLVPDLLAAGVVSVAIQRQPDTRIHLVLADGTVAILTYEPSEEIICWTTWSGDTGTSAAVEQVAVLPGLEEDAVFYHVRRTINGATKRYLEKWALESETVGDSGLTWIMDSAVSFQDTGSSATLTGLSHLVGEAVVVWSDDTGAIPGVDRSPGFDGAQTRYTVSGSGTVTLGTAVRKAVAGLKYTADWKSAKLAFGAEAGTALAQMKRSAQMGLVLYNTHLDGVRFGTLDTGQLDALPRVIEGEVIDPNYIFGTLDHVAVPIPGTHKTDPRLFIRAQSPRPCTILALIPSIQTNERV